VELCVSACIAKSLFQSSLLLTAKSATFNGGSIAWTAHRLAAATRDDLFWINSHRLNIIVHFVGAVQLIEKGNAVNHAIQKSDVTGLS